METLYRRLFEFLTRVDMVEKQWMVRLDKTRKNTICHAPMFYGLTYPGFLPKLQVKTSITRQSYQLPFTDLDSNFPSFTMALTKKKPTISIVHIAASFLAIG